MLETVSKTDIIYPSSDGEPVAETYIHLYAILTTLEVLKQYLSGQQATVLANQFMYYSQGLPRMRVAPDVMVIFNVEPGGRDNYKIWEEKEVPQLIFEMTSPGTKNQDQEFKKTLYEQLGVKEYWLFDPKGEWITEKLKGYRLRNNVYELIEDGYSEPLQLQLKVEDQLIGFYRKDTGEKLLIPEELASALQQKETELQQKKTELQQKETELQQEKQKLSEMELMLEKYRQQFGELPE
ncbi:Uma2 family endonuclease [Crocosphaera sp.]|uniref:Uma2 family endonuclease n=1 Tax=Crocosphaera sp. TaxID=2729996 RepID=UPI003F220581|nr:Uma2 family endonuclease [Crocosphaera sp.]